MGIKHRADSGFRKFRFLNKLSLGGQVRSSEMPYVSYPRPLAQTMKTVIYIVFIAFIFNSCKNDSRHSNQPAKMKVVDPTGRFDGRELEFQVASTYDNGKPEELRYYIGDTVLSHVYWKNGKLKSRITFIKGSITEMVELDSLGRKEYRTKKLNSDTLENFMFVTNYKVNGDIAATWYRANDTMWVDTMTQYLENDTILKYDNGYSGIPPDTGYIYHNKKLIGFKVRNKQNEWIEIKN